MNIELNHEYYFEEYKEFNDFIKNFISIVKDKKIKSFSSFSGLTWSEHCNFTDKLYMTDDFNYLIFDDGTTLAFKYNFFSMISIKVTHISELTDSEKEILKVVGNFDFDCYGSSIVDYELNRFHDEYMINPSTNETRPSKGDYFKELIFYLNNDKKICICPENAESDGYCDIWMENNSLKGVFNGQPHRVWWK